jgi:hypothetical protein
MPRGKKQSPGGTMMKLFHTLLPVATLVGLLAATTL